MTIKKAIAAVAGAALVFVMASIAAYAGSDYVGVWKLEDTKGEPLQITLSEGGQAKGRLVDKEMKGSWKEIDDGVLITWGTGWFTKISKDGEGYKKSAYKGSIDSPPVNTSKAEKVH